MRKLNLVPYSEEGVRKGFDTSEYMENGEWDLIGK